MVLDRPSLVNELPRPEPGPRELLLEVTACGVCHTERDEIEGRTPPPRLPVIPGHQAVGRVVEALANLAPGGRLVINAIRKEDADKDELSRIHYPTHLWMEKEIKSVANVARRDVIEFLRLAAEIPIKPEVQTYPLEEANRALVELKERRIRGAKVLVL